MVKKPRPTGESSGRANIQKVILKALGEKPAVALDSFKEKSDPKVSYSLARSIKNLVGSGYAEIHDSDNQKYVRITKAGKNKLNSIRLEGEDALVSTTWDGFWRIIILDLGEDRKSEREALRYLLKKANFVCIKNTVWISPYPYEHLFTNIKKDLGLESELMIMTTDSLDEVTEKLFLKNFGK